MHQWINYILGLNKQTESELIDSELKNLQKFIKFSSEVDLEIRKEMWDYYKAELANMKKTIKKLQEQNELLTAKLEINGQI